MSVSSALGCMSCNQNMPSQNVTQSSSCSTEKEMAIKSSLVAVYCFAIDKFIFGQDLNSSLKFGLISGVSSGVADRAASYIPGMYGANQASAFQNIIANSTMVGVVGGSGLSVILMNEPYGNVSQSKQAITVVFSEILATHMVKYFC